MKKLLLSTLFMLISTSIFAQDITGQWNGVLDALGNQLRLVFHIEKTDSGYSATLDSPDEGVEGIPFSSATFDETTLRLEAQRIAALYEGTVTADSIIGTWNQGGYAFKLKLTRKIVKKKELPRPQYPEKPYPYLEEEVVFENSTDSLTLAGTFTIPDKAGPHPAVILISGSGPQNRDEEIYGHKPFLVLADYLTRNGIAVLRYDDRGTAQSTGDHSSATSEDFASDVLSAVDFLKTRDEIDADQIGLIGHSEGGLIAPMVANGTEDVAFIVMLAGIGVPGKEISLMQSRTMRDVEVPDEEAYEQFFETVINISSSAKDVSVLKNELTRHYNSGRAMLESILPANTDIDSFIKRQVNSSLRPWARFFYNYDPATELRKITIPVLSLIGTSDVQVPAEMNHPPIKKALEAAGNKHYTIKELEGLNHMFQESETGNMSEYSQIEQTFSPLALEEITTWIKDHIK